MNNILAIDESETNISYRKSDVINEYSYKISFEELLEIFKENPEEIYKYDTGDCFSFITSENREISLSEYQKYNDNPNGEALEFVKIANKELVASGNDVIISLHDDYDISICGIPNLLNSITQLSVKDIDKYMLDLNGYDNNLNFLEIPKSLNKAINYLSFYETYIVDIEFCMKKKLTFNECAYQGYLPAVGQLEILQKALPILKYVRNEEIENKCGYWRSSTFMMLDNQLIMWQIFNYYPLTKAYDLEPKIIPMYKRFLTNAS